MSIKIFMIHITIDALLDDDKNFNPDDSLNACKRHQKTAKVLLQLQKQW